MVLPYAKPEYYVDRGDGFYITNQATTTSSNEFMPLWVKKMPNIPAKQKVEIISGKGEISSLVYSSKTIYFNSVSSNTLKVKINTVYYLGWQAKIDGVNSLISYDNDMGVMQINIPSGHHEVSFSFTETPLRLASDAVSIFGVLFLFGLILIRRKQRFYL